MYIDSDIAYVYSSPKAKISTQTVTKSHDKKDPNFFHASIQVDSVEGRRTLERSATSWAFTFI